MKRIRRRKKYGIGNIKLFLKNSLNFRNILNLLVVVMISVLVAPVVIYLMVKKEYSPNIMYNVNDLQEQRVAIVFGAGLVDNGAAPSDILKDRVEASVDLYDAGKVRKILMSGDNRYVDHNEPDVMVDYALDFGVREFDLQQDYAGRSTYETCYRAKEIFGINKAILVTQEFHLARALYICNTLGIDAIGYASDKHIYKSMTYLKAREFLATSNAFWDLFVLKPEVVLGEKIYF